MCGIFLLIDSESKYTLEQVTNYFQKIQYRGPDNTTIICRKYSCNLSGVVKWITIWFAHHRLAIINPESQNDNQPYISESTVLLVNGEIYNYKTIYENLKQNVNLGDCFSILSLYQHSGIE